MAMEQQIEIKNLNEKTRSKKVQEPTSPNRKIEKRQSVTSPQLRDPEATEEE
jgi:hypothetical protein